jgi:hypothetical protein
MSTPAADVFVDVYIQLKAAAMMSVAPVCAHDPCAMSNRSGFHPRTFCRAARAGPRRRKLARQSPGVLPGSPTRPLSRMIIPLQPEISAAEKR